MFDHGGYLRLSIKVIFILVNVLLLCFLYEPHTIKKIRKKSLYFPTNVKRLTILWKLNEFCEYANSNHSTVLNHIDLYVV